MQFWIESKLSQSEHKIYQMDGDFFSNEIMYFDLQKKNKKKTQKKHKKNTLSKYEDVHLLCFFFQLAVFLLYCAWPENSMLSRDSYSSSWFLVAGLD